MLSTKSYKKKSGKFKMDHFSGIVVVTYCGLYVVNNRAEAGLFSIQL